MRSSPREARRCVVGAIALAIMGVGLLAGCGAGATGHELSAGRPTVPSSSSAPSCSVAPSALTAAKRGTEAANDLDFTTRSRTDALLARVRPMFTSDAFQKYQQDLLGFFPQAHAHPYKTNFVAATARRLPESLSCATPLVLVTGTTTNDAPGVPPRQRQQYEVDMTEVGGRWLMTDTPSRVFGQP